MLSERTFSVACHPSFSRSSPVHSMALCQWGSRIVFPPLRAVSLRSKFNSTQTLRIYVPKALASFHASHLSKQTTKASTTPLTTTTWVDRLPRKVQPYLYLTRIDKPIGTLLLFYPCGTFSAAPGSRDEAGPA